ncbi:hypothetical protein DPMN_017510 [Dreissena polymorpha]|uniref:Uncharacterized protein n=1 Tax=Dreissena polymorpha TaxID=45954 RepID=A0A9D4NEY9_DREPO|nr:hypothetical protein DPMN_017510 [Dreissena polymorpha]
MKPSLRLFFLLVPSVVSSKIHLKQKNNLSKNNFCLLPLKHILTTLKTEQTHFTGGEPAVTSSTMSSPPETSTLPPTTTTTGARGASETTTGTAVRPTAAPHPINCTLCQFNPQLCFAQTKVEMCPDSYCINEVTNKEDGSKWVDRRQVI